MSLDLYISSVSSVSRGSHQRHQTRRRSVFKLSRSSQSVSKPHWEATRTLLTPFLNTIPQGSITGQNSWILIKKANLYTMKWVKASQDIDLLIRRLLENNFSLRMSSTLQGTNLLTSLLHCLLNIILSWLGK